MPGPIRITVGGPARPRPVVPAGGSEPTPFANIGASIARAGERIEQQGRRADAETEEALAIQDRDDKQKSAIELSRAMGIFNSAVERAENDIIMYPDAKGTEILGKLHSATDAVSGSLTGDAKTAFDAEMSERAGAIDRRLERQKYTSDVGRMYSAARSKFSQITEEERRAILAMDDVESLSDENIRKRFNQYVQDGMPKDPIAAQEYKRYLGEVGDSMLGNHIDLARARRDRQLAANAAAQVETILGSITPDNVVAKRAEAQAALAKSGLLPGEIDKELVDFDASAKASIAGQEKQALNRQIFAVVNDTTIDPAERVATMRALMGEQVNRFGMAHREATSQIEAYTKDIHSEDISRRLREEPTVQGSLILTDPEFFTSRGIDPNSETANEFREQARVAIADDLSWQHSDDAIEAVARPTDQEIFEMRTAPWKIDRIQRQILDRIDRKRAEFDSASEYLALAKNGKAIATRADNSYRKARANLVDSLSEFAHGADIVTTPGRSDLSEAGVRAVNRFTAPIAKGLREAYLRRQLPVSDMAAEMTRTIENAGFMPAPWRETIESLFASNDMGDRMAAASLFHSAASVNPAIRENFPAGAMLDKLFYDAQRPGFDPEEYRKRVFDVPANVKQPLEAWRMSPLERRHKVFYTDHDGGSLPAGSFQEWQEAVEKSIVATGGRVSIDEAMNSAFLDVSGRGVDRFSPKRTIGAEAQEQIDGDIKAIMDRLKLGAGQIRSQVIIDPDERDPAKKYAWMIETQGADGVWRPYANENGEYRPLQARPDQYRSVIEAAEKKKENERVAAQRFARRQASDAFVYRELRDMGFSAQALASAFSEMGEITDEEFNRRSGAIPEADRRSMMARLKMDLHSARALIGAPSEDLSKQANQIQKYLGAIKFGGN